MLLGGAAELPLLASKDIFEHILQVREPCPDRVFLLGARLFCLLELIANFLFKIPQALNCNIITIINSD